MVSTLAECGAAVSIHYHRQKNQAERVLKEIQAKGAKGIIVQADVTDLASVLEMKKHVEKELGAPDIIVNNAVIQYKWKPVLEQDLDDY